MRRLALLLFAGIAAACGKPTPEVQAKVNRWALQFGLDPILLSAVVWVESRYCPQAVGAAGEIGLAQVKPIVARTYSLPEDILWNPDNNLAVAARYLRDLYLRFGDWYRALAAYNRGPTRVAENGVDAKGHAYAVRVLSVYWYWKGGKR